MMLGIGVDDMFVICNALDQISLKLPAKERMIKALRHSGPSITITSLTNALAFLSGAYTNVPVVEGFCVYCCVTVGMLYLTVITIFLPVVYWDAKRISSRNKECCGLLRCSKNSIFFFKGKLLSDD